VPTYQYQCTECGEGLEAVQKFTDDALTECPSCGGRLKKVFSAVGIVFKGSGFYRNDSRNTSSSSSPASSKSSGSSSSSDSSSSSSTSSSAA
jgi:putative FmdB family regulatory protein